jgi:hypothetical protein
MPNLSDAEDVAIDGNYDVFISHRGDVGVVAGRDAFEQEVALRLQDRYEQVVSEVEPEAMKAMLLNRAQRVAEEMDLLEEVADFRAEEDPQQANRINVTIIFNTGEPLTFNID